MRPSLSCHLYPYVDFGAVYLLARETLTQQTPRSTRLLQPPRGVEAPYPRRHLGRTDRRTHRHPRRNGELVAAARSSCSHSSRCHAPTAKGDRPRCGPDHRPALRSAAVAQHALRAVLSPVRNRRRRLGRSYALRLFASRTEGIITRRWAGESLERGGGRCELGRRRMGSRQSRRVVSPAFWSASDFVLSIVSADRLLFLPMSLRPTQCPAWSVSVINAPHSSPKGRPAEHDRQPKRRGCRLSSRKSNRDEPRGPTRPGIAPASEVVVLHRILVREIRPQANCQQA